MSNHPLTDEFFDKLGVYGEDSQTPYQFACELEGKLAAECRSTTKLTNELLDVKLELAVATKQRDALLEALDGMVHCAESRIKPIATLQQAREAIAKAKGATP